MQKKPEHELRFTKPRLKTLADLSEWLTGRIVAVTQAQQIKDHTMRAKAMRLVTRGRMLIGRIVPFIVRPRRLDNILLADRIKRSLAAIRNKEPNDKSNDKPNRK
jgi:hypothetical protein